MTSPRPPAFAPPRDRPFRDAAAVIRQVQLTEAAWFKQGDPRSPYNPWMPFAPADFLWIAFECIPEMKGREFLDVGCGPGTKMLLARHFFGLEPSGIEIDPDMARAAQVHGGVRTADALLVAGGLYGNFDLIWLYRPFRDIAREAELEARIMDEMKPGAILAGGAWEICPADHGWIPVVDDWELRRGAWMKPVLPVADHRVLSCCHEPARIRQALPDHRLGLVLDHLVLRRLRDRGGHRPDQEHAGHAELADLGPGEH